MPRAKKRKGTSFQNSLTKSVFLNGRPNKGKTELLSRMERMFLSLVNNNIRFLSAYDGIALQLIKNDKKDSVMRQLEKQMRKKGINSAFSQNAFDTAVTHLSNRLDDIRKDMYAENQTIFTQSKVLFGMAVDGKSKADMIAEMIAIDKDKNGFHRDCADALTDISEEEFAFFMTEFQDAYVMHSLEYKIPVLKSVQMPLDSRLMKIEPSVNIEAPFVISITDPFCKNNRFTVPLNTSRHSLHKINSRKMAGTVMAFLKNGILKIGWAYTQSMKQPKTTNVVGVDTGILDALYTSEGAAIGTMKTVLDFYHNEVETAFAELSSLRNKKRAISHYLHKHPDLPTDVRRSLIQKMDRLERMIQTAEAPYRKKRHYYGLLEEAIKKAVSGYMNTISHDTLTVLERLDIKEFDKSRKLNGMLSTFARGRLQKRLMDELNWRGYDFMEVEPSFTSQVCPVCGNLSDKNRDGKSFKCTCCGYEGDADNVASVNIKARAEDKEILALCEKHKYSLKNLQNALKKLYAERNEVYLNKQNLLKSA